MSGFGILLCGFLILVAVAALASAIIAAAPAIAVVLVVGAILWAVSRGDDSPDDGKKPP